MTVLPYFYFGNTQYYQYLLQEDCIFETQEHFVKQTDRTRCTIATSLGAQNLLLSLIRQRKTGVKTGISDIKIQDEMRTKKKHWKSICTAYQRSPFFEYYQDDLAKLFLTEHDFLIQWNKATIAWVMQILKPDFIFQETTNYNPAHFYNLDLRNASFHENKPIKYRQTFMEKIGFIPNICILDFLFNQGTKI
jgi:hypothetical protein